METSSRDLIYPVNPPRKAGSNLPLASATPVPSQFLWPTPSPRPRAPLAAPGERLLKVDGVEVSGASGETRKVTVRIARVSTKNIEADQAKVTVLFYEKSAGGSVDITESRVNPMWASPPIDWRDTEVLEMSCPAPAKGSGKTYLGCTIEVSYRDVPQDRWKSLPDLP